MNNERNPLLEQLFAEADQNYDGEAFVAGVMARANKLRLRRLIALLAAGLAVVPAIGLVLNDVVQSLTEFISQPIMVGGSAIAILAPLNSIASVLGLGLLGLLAIYRWLFS